MIKIHSVETFGAHEGPGIRVVFFTQGCLMKCLYCHNPDTIDLEGGKEYNIDSLMDIVYKTKPYFGNKGGVTMSGGECLLQAKQIIPLFKRLQQEGIHTCLDTNGYIFNDDVKELLKYTDLVLLDIKHFDNDKHKELTGVGNKKIFEFANYLEQNNNHFWIRHVLIPDYTSADEHIESMGKYFKDFKSLDRFEILPYHTLGVHKWEELGWDYKLNHVSAPDREMQLRAKEILEKYIEVVKIRG